MNSPGTAYVIELLGNALRDLSQTNARYAARIEHLTAENESLKSLLSEGRQHES